MIKTTAKLGVWILACSLLTGSTAFATTSSKQDIAKAFENKNLSELKELMTQNPAHVDLIVKELLGKTEQTLGQNPRYANEMMSLAGNYAPQITPPTVPEVCSSLRRIVEATATNEQFAELYETVMTTSQNFASAPVVVAAGRPNSCEDAWLQASNFNGEAALLAQQPGMRSPGLPAITIEPGLPINEPSNKDKPSAD